MPYSAASPVSSLRSLVAPNAGPFTLDGTRTFIVGRHRPVVVDPGPDSEAHLNRVAEEVADAEEVTILLTHDHSDHAGGAARLSALLGAPVLGPGSGRGRMEPGDSFQSDAGELVAVPTPGHASPHFSFHWTAEDAVFVGDLLLGQGKTTWVGAYPGCVADYLESLDRVESLKPAVLYPAHGPAVFRVSRVVERFRRHRVRRLDQLRALRESYPDASTETLARKIYGVLDGQGLHEAGLKSVEAMLHHLDTTGGAEGEVEVE